MTPPSVIALFCEDIREETGSRVTLVGVMPDNMQGRLDPNMPAGGTPVIPKLCIYTRLHFDPNDDIGPVKSNLVFPSGETRDIKIFETAMIEKASDTARNQGIPYAGIASRIIIPNFPILVDGVLRVEVIIRNQTYIAGALKLTTINPPASASEQPSVQ